MSRKYYLSKTGKNKYELFDAYMYEKNNENDKEVYRYDFLMDDFLKYHNSKYKNKHKRNIVESFINSHGGNKKLTEKDDIKIDFEKDVGDETIYFVANLYNIFRNFNFEKVENQKLDNARKSFIDISRGKKFLAKIIIDSFASIEIDESNKDTVEKMLKILLNDATFFFGYVHGNGHALRIMENVIMTLSEFYDNDDTLYERLDIDYKTYFENDTE
jgi:hypothetical protein